MKKFLVTYHAPVTAMAQMANAPADQQAKGMEAWMQWAQRCGDKLVDMGAPLMNSQQISPDGSTADSTKNVCGYSVLQAENMDEAKSLVQGHPHISGWSPDATLEVHETVKLPGM
jgi:hypothetical protein